MFNMFDVLHVCYMYVVFILQICDHPSTSLSYNGDISSHTSVTSLPCPKITRKILLAKGPMVTPRNIAQQFHNRYRPTSDRVRIAMQQLETEGFGFINSNARGTALFIKTPPESIGEKLSKVDIPLDVYTMMYQYGIG